MVELVEIGRVVKTHGLRGDVVVELVTDREERMAPGSRLEARRDRRTETLVVAVARQQRRASGARRARWIVRFEGLADVDAADRWRDAVLLAEPLEDPDALWVHDMVGADVVLAAGARVGSCVAVVANPAADLLELDSGALIPVVFVVERSASQVVIDPPDGLLDL